MSKPIYVPKLIKDSNGVDRMMACLPRETPMGEMFPEASEKWRVDEKDWNLPEYRQITLQLIAMIWHVINQARQGSCTLAGTAGELMLRRRFSGLPNIVFSQGSGYAFTGTDSNGEPIARRSDNGTAIDSGLAILRDIGLCPTKIGGKTFIDQYDWEGYRRGTWPPNWRQIASLNRCREYADVMDDHLAISFTKHGKPVVYGSQNHCVILLGELDGELLSLNSWDYDWGKNGVGVWADRRQLKRDVPGYGAWVSLTTTDPLGEGDVPHVRTRSI